MKCRSICHTWSIWQILKQFRPPLSNPEQGHIHFRISRNTGVCHRSRKWREALNRGTSSSLGSLLQLKLYKKKRGSAKPPNDPHKKCIQNDNSLSIQLCPKKGINPTFLLWGWDWDHQTYSREGSGCLGIINLINLNWSFIEFEGGPNSEHNPVFKTNVDTFGPNKNMVAIEFTVFKQKIQHCYLQSWSPQSILVNFWVAFSDLALQLFSQGSNKVWP